MSLANIENQDVGGKNVVPTRRWNVQAQTTTFTGTNVAFFNTNPDTITRTTGSYITDGYNPGDTITISGSALNNGIYTIATVGALTLTLIAGDVLAAEAAGPNVTVLGNRPFASIKAGEPVKIAASRNYAMPVQDAEPVIGTTSDTLGIAQSTSTETATEDGFVDIYMPTDAIWEIKAKSIAAVDTQAEINALIGKRVVYDLTAGKYTIDTFTPSYSATTIAFAATNPDTITDTANGFITAGYVAGDYITISGSTLNNGTFEIATVAAGTITLVPGVFLANEVAGASVVTAGDNPAFGLEIVGGNVDEKSLYFIIRQAATDLN